MKLKTLMAAERTAFAKMMNGSEADARTVRGEEGKNYIAWCAAADAERAHREANDNQWIDGFASRQG